jgi:hypothetical protein
MPEYEGFVASLIDDDKAEVLIQPEREGIVGAPGISAKVCHCASSSSQVTMEALNPMKAAVGDQVVLEVEASALIRNVASLVGLPVLALALGWVISLLLGDTVLLGLPITFFCIFCSLPLGVAAGVLLYRHWSQGHLPTITRILQTRQEIASSFANAPESKA